MKEEALSKYYKNAHCHDIELKPYHDLFVKKVIETHNILNLEDNDGENHFFDKDVFKEFFTSADLLIGFYSWRTGGFLTDTIDLFEEEFEGWVDECKEMALNSKDILKNIYAKQLANNVYKDNFKDYYENEDIERE